jgi:hypothetical protein
MVEVKKAPLEDGSPFARFQRIVPDTGRHVHLPIRPRFLA